MREGLEPKPTALPWDLFSKRSHGIAVGFVVGENKSTDAIARIGALGCEIEIFET